MITSLPVNAIKRRSDARALNPVTVTSIADSISQVGLINPIRVRRVGAEWEVVAGSHRLAACAELGLVEIECAIVTEDDLHAELAMIDENLMRAELSASERAEQTARRKVIYLELHPETAHGAVGRAGYEEKSGQPVHSFADATAAVTGSDSRTVRRDAERGEKVIPEVMNLIRGTKLDTGAFLDRIKKLPPNEQVVATKRELSFIRQQSQSKKPKVANDPQDAFQVHEAMVASLMAAWNKASKQAREDFLARIGTPVFDRSAA